ncbi:molybdopterin biosynthesis protein [Candidatus Bathyarchaeota archaeon]|nr:molybdopterin biosynthesis protein [Candidatus Bathyarchaeota archaeon]
MSLDRKIFRKLINIEEAESIIANFLSLKPFGCEEVLLEDAYGRVLAEDVVSKIDVPSFDKSAMDGYAVIAEDTYEASEAHPIKLKVKDRIEAGEKSEIEVFKGEAAEVSTGAAIPKGSNAVVMVEYTKEVKGEVEVFKPVRPGENIIAAGSDIMMGETILRLGQKLTFREVGILAALGLKKIKVYKKPVVALISTGNELVNPGETLTYGKIYDINSYSLRGALIECGAQPINLGVASDDEKEIKMKVEEALEKSDIVVTSGSTSAGVGDIMYKVINELGEPGVIIHGLSVKPGKPTIVGIVKGKLIFGLPGYPSSAASIFNALVKPIILKLSGLKIEEAFIKAKMPFKVFSAKGRREFIFVHLVKSKDDYLAYPILSDSGAISSFALADGYIDVPAEVEFIEENEEVKVHLFSSKIEMPELIFIGSHCIGVDLAFSLMQKKNYVSSFKIINVGSFGGLKAVEKGEADLAGIHLLDESSKEYNMPYLKKMNLIGKVALVKGYSRRQGFIVAKGNPKKIKNFEDLFRSDVTFINRNKGSGTRVLIDLGLKEVAEKLGFPFEEAKLKIKGYNVEAKTHSAVATAVKYGKADAGVGIEYYAKSNNLSFIPISNENYDFLISIDRLEKEPVKKFLLILSCKEFQKELIEKFNFIIDKPGEVIC